MVAAFWMVLASAVLQRIQPLSGEVSTTSWSRSLGIMSLAVWALVLVLSYLLPHPHIQKVPQELLVAYAVLGIVHVVAASLVSGLVLRSAVIGPARS